MIRIRPFVVNVFILCNTLLFALGVIAAIVKHDYALLSLFLAGFCVCLIYWIWLLFEYLKYGPLNE